MSVSEKLLGLPSSVRDPVGAALVRLPWSGSKLLGFVASPSVRADPWELYRQLREATPVLPTRFGATVVTRHADALLVLRHPSVSVDESRSTEIAHHPRDRAFSRLARHMLLMTDPPDHERLRRLISKAFTPRQVRRMEDAVGGMVSRRVDRWAGRGGADILADLAYPLPVQVICELFGLPPDDEARLIEWAGPLAARLDVQPVRSAAVERAGDVAADAFQAYLHDVVADPARRMPGGLIDELVAAEDAGYRLTREEVVATCALVLLAGFETTANLVANGLLALLTNRAQLDMVRNGDVPMGVAVEELLRHDGPVQLTRRVLVDDLTVGGIDLPAGALVVLLLAAANRDPEVFRNPEALDVGRDPNPHLAFSTGIHACLGAALARLETGVIIGHLLDRFPRLRLAGQPAWRDNFVLRGLQGLPVTWT
jgi:cytochrome P450